MNFDKIDFTPTKPKETLLIRDLPEGTLDKLDSLAALKKVSREKLARTLITHMVKGIK